MIKISVLLPRTTIFLAPTALAFLARNITWVTPSRYSPNNEGFSIHFNSWQSQQYFTELLLIEQKNYFTSIKRVLIIFRLRKVQQLVFETGVWQKFLYISFNFLFCNNWKGFRYFLTCPVFPINTYCKRWYIYIKHQISSLWCHF